MIHQAKMENKYHISSPPTQKGNHHVTRDRVGTGSSSPPVVDSVYLNGPGGASVACGLGTSGLSGIHGDKDRATYLQQLIKDQKCCLSYPNVFHHVERLLSEEIVKVRSVLFQNNNRPLELPSPSGKTVTMQKKVFVPAKEYPDYNFVGRILGPRGLTAKQLEQETGCKIMVRGKGSMRDKKKEEQNRGRPNWEHLNEELHVLITVEDSENRAEIKLQRAIAEIEKLLIPAIEGEDDLKKKQLMELAIINGTYRDNSNGQKQNGMTSSARLTAVPLTGGASLQLMSQGASQFRLPTALGGVGGVGGVTPVMTAPGMASMASVLRPNFQNIGMTQAMTQMEQPGLYYAQVPTLDGTQGYPYITGGLMNGMESYVSSNVSPHEGMETPGAGQSNTAHGYANGAGQTLGVAVTTTNGGGPTHVNAYAPPQQRHLLVNGPMPKKIEN